MKVLHPTKQIYPPMHALRALEAFARLGTVWEAAEQLGITRSALSHRLAMLEGILGFDVAVRSGKGVALTPRGRRYALDVQKSLELLRGAHDDGSRPIEGNLCISSTPGFAAMWLCNHIASFQGEHPDLNLQILVNRELDEASDPNVDLFIVFGEGSWPKQHVQHLYDVEFLPMCSPTLLNMHGGLKEPADLLRFPLLHLNEWGDWQQWMTAAGMQFPRRTPGIRFSDLMMVQTAAVSGQGTMMGDVITCAGALSSGQLVTPFPLKVKARGGYYLVRGQKRPSLAINAFTRWLRALFKRINPELQVGPLS
ncbi:MAG TPA: LysR substrate-binding domain-containing protein [Steroidobacteraceae bacterium]